MGKTIVGLIPAVGAIAGCTNVATEKMTTGKIANENKADLILQFIGLKKYKEGSKKVSTILTTGFSASKDAINNFALGEAAPYAVIEEFNKRHGSENFKLFESSADALAELRDIYETVGIEFNESAHTVYDSKDKQKSD